jgi:hypothetical protein
MAQLKKLGAKTQDLAHHGATGDIFGVKIGDLKTVAKKIKAIGSALAVRTGTPCHASRPGGGRGQMSEAA